MPRLLLLVLSALSFAGCISIRSAQELQTSQAQQQSADLAEQLLSLLPAELAATPEARQEARALADAAYRGSAAIARINRPLFPCWLNNRIINSPFRLRDRGLCWQWQEDLFRELRRIPTSFFRLGCCVRDAGNRHEHHAVYLAPVGAAWPCVRVLDAWRYQGHLLVLTPREVAEDEWVDEPQAAQWLGAYFPAGHSLPMEQWARVRSDNRWDYREYFPISDRRGQNTKQYREMTQRIREGLQQRNGKPTDY